MTEPCPAFQAMSEAYPASPLDQTDGPPSQDLILFLPMIQSSNMRVTVCLHLVHHDDGTLGVCNTKTKERCVGCGCLMCEQHQSPYALTIPEEQRVPLCETCATLPLSSVLAIREFRRLINSPERVDL